MQAPTISRVASTVRSGDVVAARVAIREIAERVDHQNETVRAVRAFLVAVKHFIESAGDPVHRLDEARFDGLVTELAHAALPSLDRATAGHIAAAAALPDGAVAVKKPPRVFDPG